MKTRIPNQIDRFPDVAARSGASDRGDSLWRPRASVAANGYDVLATPTALGRVVGGAHREPQA